MCHAKKQFYSTECENDKFLLMLSHAYFYAALEICLD